MDVTLNGLVFRMGYGFVWTVPENTEDLAFISDKWKDIVLQKMKIGSNRSAKEFLDSQSDLDPNLPISEKYNIRAAALYRDKITTEAQGKNWSVESSSAKDYTSRIIPKNSSAFNLNSNASVSNPKPQTTTDWEENEWTSNSYQSFDAQQISRQKEDFFARKQSENMSRPEDLPPSQGDGILASDTTPILPEVNQIMV